MKSLLVIGAGYIGAELIHQADSAGWRTYAGTRSGEGGTLAMDVSALSSLDALKAQIGTPNVIVHCASSGRGGEEAYRAVFEEGVKNIIATFPESALIFVSSSSVYAQINGETVTEDSPAEPTRETGKILKRTEAQVIRHNGIVARLSGIYGPARSVLIKRLLKDEAQIEEDGRRIINQIHQYDGASALLHLAENYSELTGQVYNVSDSNPRSQKATYEGLCEKLTLPFPPVGQRDLNRKRGWTHKAVSNAKLLATGWEPNYPDFIEVSPQIAESLEL